MTERYDVLIIGAGPGGLAAARAAASHGARVGLVDLQARLGGQVWRQDWAHAAPAAARRAFRAVGKTAAIAWLPQTTVVAADAGRLLVQTPAAARWLAYGQLILATGARELLLPFPGWTLPGVMGAGGLQALAKQGWPLRGQRVLISGSGPLLLAAAATAKRHGAHVLGIHEQAPRAAVLRFARGLWHWPGKAAQALRLRAYLAGVPYRMGSVITAVQGAERVTGVEIDGPGGHSAVACDLLATGYGLVPNVRLARMLGCALTAAAPHPAVAVDARQQTSVAGIYAVGEACGIGGRDAALAEGAIAGHAAAGMAALPAALLQRRARARAFAALLQRSFALGPLARALTHPDTIVCRCEDVAWGALKNEDSSRSAKLATRCGMGPCQGRICGAALAALDRFPHEGARAPLFPARLATLATAAEPAAE